MERNHANQFMNEGVISCYFENNSTANKELINKIVNKIKLNDISYPITEFSEFISRAYEKEIENNHATGSYYTPPELTYWICEFAFCKYFQKKWFPKIEEAIFNIKSIKYLIESNPELNKLTEMKNWIFNLRICDNACGTGQFLVQIVIIINEILEFLEIIISKGTLNADLSQNSENRRIILEKVIFGVDRNSEAVEITKFRLWLWFFDNQNKDRVDFKFCDNIRCGDSLMEFNWKFEFPQIFSSQTQDLNGFDIIIGNPPYIKSRKQDWELHSGSKTQLLEYYQNIYPQLRDYLTLALDYSIYFILNSIQLLRKEGWNCYLITNKWIRAAYGQSIRKLISQELNFDTLIELNDSTSFKTANVDLCIFLIQNLTSKNTELNYAKFYPIEEKQKKSKEVIKWKKINQKDLGESPWNFDKTSLDEEICSWLSRKFKPIKEKGFIYGKGLETGANSAFMITTIQRYKFIQQNPNSDRIIKPFILGEGINPYQIQWDEKWILFLPWHFPFHESNKPEQIKIAEESFKHDYPAIYAHLKNFKNELDQRAPSEKGRYEWYTLKRYAAQYYRYFSVPKIMWQELAAYGKFAWDPLGFFPGNSAYMITNCSPSYTIVLNSNIVDFYFGHLSKTIGKDARRHTSKFIEQIVVPDLPNSFDPLIEYIQFSGINNEIMRKLEALNYELYLLDKFYEDGIYPEKKAYILTEFLKDLESIPYNEWAQHVFNELINPKSKENTNRKIKLGDDIKFFIEKYFSQILKNEELEKFQQIIFNHPWVQYLEQKRRKKFNNAKSQQK